MTTPLRERMRLMREEAIVDVVNRLLADKGYEFMTVDEVAAEVGLAKASLYKHFASKEALAAAAMVRVLERALAALDEIERGPPRAAIERLHEVLRWTMRTLYEGQMPNSAPAGSASGSRTACASSSAAPRAGARSPRAVARVRSRP